MEAVLSGILLAVLTGLTIIAYRHPKGYTRIYYGFFWTMLFGLTAFLFYVSVVGLVVYKLSPFIEENKKDGFDQAVHSLYPSNLLWLAAPVVFLLYLGFLRFLPMILENESDQSPNQNIESDQSRNSKSG